MRPPRPTDSPTGNQAAQWRSLRRVIEEHGRTDARWLEYELDFAKLLDFPLMTDMRDPLTIGFHKAKLRADFLRPVKAEDLLDDRDAAAHYLAAVEDYVTAFNVAEAEANRRRRNDFSRRRPTADCPRSAPVARGLGLRRGAAGTPERLRPGPQRTRWPHRVAVHDTGQHRARDLRSARAIAAALTHRHGPQTNRSSIPLFIATMVG